MRILIYVCTGCTGVPFCTTRCQYCPTVVGLRERTWGQKTRNVRLKRLTASYPPQSTADSLLDVQYVCVRHTLHASEMDTNKSNHLQRFQSHRVKRTFRNAPDFIVVQHSVRIQPGKEMESK